MFPALTPLPKPAVRACGLIALGIMALLPPRLAVAQSDPSELQSLRNGYLSRVASANRSLTEQYMAALQRHERELGLGGDYEEAIRAAAKIEQLKQQQSILESGGGQSEEGKIVLRAGDARMTNGAAYDAMNDVATDWGKSGASATWSILRMEPGEYEVRVIYAVARPEATFDQGGLGEFFPQFRRHGGSFLLRDVNTLRPEEETRIEFSLSSTGGWDAFETKSIDTIEFSRPSANIRIESTQSRDGQVANIRGLELIPLAKPPGQPESTAGLNAPSSGDSQELVQLKTSHRQRIELAAASQVISYARLLEELEQRYLNTNRDDMASAVRMERQDPLQRVGLPPVSTLSKSETDVDHLPGGFQVMHGAEFVPHPENRTDCFFVRHNDQIFKVRLYFVTGPDPEPATSEDNLRIAAYFGIKPEDARTLAETGMNLLAHSLEEHDFSLVTQWIPDEQGCYHVRVMLAGLGSLERTLVSRGLVAIKGRVIDSPHMPGQAYVDSILREAEKGAREGRRGGWGMDESPQDSLREANGFGSSE